MCHRCHPADIIAKVMIHVNILAKVKHLEIKDLAINDQKLDHFFSFHLF